MRHHQLLASKQVTKNVYNLAVKYGTSEKELNHQKTSTLSSTENLCSTCPLSECRDQSIKCPIVIAKNQHIKKALIAEQGKAKRKAAKELKKSLTE